MEIKANKLTEEQWEQKRKELCNCGVNHSLLSLHEEWCEYRKFAMGVLLEVCGK